MKTWWAIDTHMRDWPDHDMGTTLAPMTNLLGPIGGSSIPPHHLPLVTRNQAVTNPNRRAARRSPYPTPYDATGTANRGELPALGWRLDIWL